jgi:hypothetical protein
LVANCKQKLGSAHPSAQCGASTSMGSQPKLAKRSGACQGACQGAGHACAQQANNLLNEHFKQMLGQNFWRRRAPLRRPS